MGSAQVSWSNKVSVELTDPARELAALGRWIAGLPSADIAFGAHLANSLQLSAHSSSYLALLASARLRMERMRQFTEDVDDSDFDDFQRKQALIAIERLSGVFFPENQAAGFNGVRNASVVEVDLTVLSWFSYVARRHRPLRLITDAMRQDAMKAVDEAREKVAGDSDLPKWAKLLLLEGLEQVRLTISCLTFFGHEAAFDALLLLDQRNQGVIAALKAQALSVGQSVWETSKALTVCVAIFNAPVTVHNAFLEYQSFLAKIVAAHHAPLALPKPPESSADSGSEDAEVSEAV